jgi:hypothetical protein
MSIPRPTRVSLNPEDNNSWGNGGNSYLRGLQYPVFEIEV